MAIQTNPVDVERAVPAVPLGAWLRDNVDGAGGPVRVEQLAGGSSNLTFRIRDDRNDWVLRRPPLRGVLATAHDMAREHRVQRALEGSDVPVARQVAMCGDESVIGAPFYVMERLDGVVYDDVDAVRDLSAAQSRSASFELIDVLARLHAVEPDAVGLGDFGRPQGYLARQVGRWRKQWEQSKIKEVPATEDLALRLERALPSEGRHGIVHGDYSFNNTMFRADDPTRMQAVLDWEMSTLGDPLTDVGTLAVYWGEAGEVMWRDRPPQAHRANAGFPPVQELLERYTRTSGVDLTRIGYYQAFACYKLAVIAMGGARRLADGDPARVERIFETIGLLTEIGLRLSAPFAAEGCP